MNQAKMFIHKKFPWLLYFWRAVYNAYLLGLDCKTRVSSRSAQRKVDEKLRCLRVTKSPVRVGFYVYNSAVFPLERVFQRMQEDVSFDPKIVVSWGDRFGSEDRRQNDFRIHQQSLRYFREKYGPNVVLDSFENNRPVDYSDQFDICASMRPYDDGMLECCKISYLAQKGIPVFFAWYGFEGGVIWDQSALKMLVFRYLWRFYTGTESMKGWLERYHPILCKNMRVVLSGNPKIEPLAFVKHKVRDRKRIIVAPHHTILEGERFYISNFVRFAEFLVDLPRRYPAIDWIFRPHPNLMTRMVTNGFWTEGKRAEYLARWSSYPNAIYQSGGTYYDDFVNSDGMIQDCCSFLAEYHATGNPQCYMLKSPEHALTQYDGLGLKMLDFTYKAYSEEDIIKYIENVVIKGNDKLKEARMTFLNSTLLVNYPHVSQFIVNDIKKALCRV